MTLKIESTTSSPSSASMRHPCSSEAVNSGRDERGAKLSPNLALNLESGRNPS